MTDEKLVNDIESKVWENLSLKIREKCETILKLLDEIDECREGKKQDLDEVFGLFERFKYINYHPQRENRIKWEKELLAEKPSLVIDRLKLNLEFLINHTKFLINHTKKLFDNYKEIKNCTNNYKYTDLTLYHF